MFIRDFRDFFDKERVILKTQGAVFNYYFTIIFLFCGIKKKL